MIAALLAVLLLVFAAVSLFRDKGGDGPAVISAFRVEQPNFVAEGKDLKAVEVWAITAGTALTGGAHIKIGDMGKETKGDPERWVLKIPKDPLTVAQVYVKGVNDKGNDIGHIYLTETGEGALRKLIWNLEGDVNQTTTVSGKVMSVAASARALFIDVNGKELGVAVKADTRLSGINGEVIQFSAFKPGQRVSAEGRYESDDAFLADSVRVAGQ